MSQPENSSSPVKVDHEFRPRDFVGRHVMLDFSNTVTGRDGARRDWLATPAALADWAVKSGLLDEGEGERLLAHYRAEPEDGERALARAGRLREAVYALLSAVMRGEPPPIHSLDAIEREWRTASTSARIRWGDDEGLRAEPTPGAEIVTDRIALLLMTSAGRLASARLRRCAGENCGWLFLDTSKAGRRRWCDMATCGNASKYARVRARSDRADPDGRDSESTPG